MKIREVLTESSDDLDPSKVKPDMLYKIEQFYRETAKSYNRGMLEYPNHKISHDVYVRADWNNKKLARILFSGQNYDVYTARRDEEDDDHPIPNKNFKVLAKKLKELAKAIFPGAKIEINGSEKYYVDVSVIVKAKDVWK